DAPLASRHAVHTVMSGPASGAIAAARIGVAAGLPNLITCDMGGTSFDVSVIVDGVPAVSREKSIDYAIPLRIPMVDIHTIGAGPQQASLLEREHGVPKILVPRFPGITSALGCVLADVRHDFGITVNRPLLDVDGGWADAILAGQVQAGRDLIEREAVNVTG